MVNIGIRIPVPWIRHGIEQRQSSNHRVARVENFTHFSMAQGDSPAENQGDTVIQATPSSKNMFENGASICLVSRPDLGDSCLD